MLTRDIYRDFYKDSGPTIGERLFVASKRLCIVFAGAALSLGALDVMGVHSIVGATAALHDAPAKLASFGETLRNGISSISFKAPSMESIRVAIPQQTVIRFSTKKEPTVIDDLVAVRAQDAVSACHDLGAADLRSRVAAQHFDRRGENRSPQHGESRRARHHEIPGACGWKSRSAG